MGDVAHNILLIWIGAMLTVAVLLWLRDKHMTKHFDPNHPDHVMSLAVMLDGILNSQRRDVRFALLVWQDRHPDIQGLISNDTDDESVLEMLDDAKRQIDQAKGMIHKVHGHA
jgi:hypothetical protein